MNIGAISEIIDEIALEKPLDWESFNYESVKQVAILGAIEEYSSIINNSDLTKEERDTALVAILSYLIMENTQAHIELLRLKRG